MKKTKKQHLVPEVYTKAWKTDVVNKKEPDKIFQGVYVFEKGEAVGNGFNTGSVLWKPHLYTVGFEYFPMGEEQMMNGVWYSELYKIFFKKSGGFYHHVIAKTLEGCQMILFEAYDDAGTFATSDNPSFQNITLAIERENATGFVFPITPKYLLFIGKGSHKSIDIVDHRFANRDTIKHFNRIKNRSKMNVLISCEKMVDSII